MYIPAVVMVIGGTIVAIAFHIWARCSESEPEQPAGLPLSVTAIVPLAMSFVVFSFCFDHFAYELEPDPAVALPPILIGAICATSVGLQSKYLISGLTMAGWGSHMGVTLAWVVGAENQGNDQLWVNFLFLVCLALVGIQSVAGLLLGLWADHRMRDEVLVA